MSKKIKYLKRFRVKVGDKYCSLSHQFHELGTVHPDRTLETAHVFNTSVMAENCIERTVSAQASIRSSLYPNYKGFDPLRFEGIPAIEEFQIEEAT